MVLPETTEHPSPPGEDIESKLADRLAQVARGYSAAERIHDSIPASFRYWNERYIKPAMLSMSVGETPHDMFVQRLVEQFQAKPDRRLQFVSIGAGECAEEIAVARRLIAAGRENFSFECIDVASGALERAKSAADAAGVGRNFVFLNGVYAQSQHTTVDAVMANQCLHHFTDLEFTFDKIKQTIGDDGIFLTNDMIGRNGHMLWPEALAVVDRLWERLPAKYRYNHCMEQLEEKYSNWDNSKEENEGIRAQDILPELIKRFHFDFFFAAGNITSSIFGRHYGDNFDPGVAEDLEWIDQISRLDFDLIDVGFLTPVLMFACMSNRQGPTQCYRHWTPEFCVRKASPIETPDAGAYRLGETLLFSQRLPTDECLIEGWSSPEVGGVWSNAPMSLVRIPFRGGLAPGRYLLSLSGFQFTANGIEPGGISLSVNDKTTRLQLIDTQHAAIEFESAGQAELTVRFRYDRCFSPSALGINADSRALALRLISMTVAEAPP